MFFVFFGARVSASKLHNCCFDHVIFKRTMSSSREVFKSLQKIFPAILDSAQNCEIALKISTVLITEGLKPFQEDQNRTNQALLSELNPSVVTLVLSNSRVPIRSLLSFFEFLRTSQSSVASKPDLQAHVTLAQRLFESRNFAQMKNVVKSIVIDNDLRCSVSKIVALIKSNGNGEPNFVEKLCDMAFRVYASNGMFEEALEVFDYTDREWILIEERSCVELLVTLKKSNRIDLCLRFFDLMVQRGIQITVYSLTIAIDCLCRIGDVEKAKVLISDLAGREIVKPNVFTYNTVAKACIERKDFDGVNEVLRLMERDNVDYNVVTFTLLIEWYGGCGKIEEACKLFDEMCDRGTEPDVYVYTSLIKWTCRAGKLKRAFSLFDELADRGLVPSVHTYGTLINGLCKVGQMEAAEMLVREMESKGMGANQVVFNMLMDGFCRKGMIDRAMRLKDVMESKGLEIDIFCYNSIASGLCNLNRNEEAKRLLFLMTERGVSPNLVSFTTLINIYCKEGNFVEAKWVLREMEKKNEKPNVVTYNALIDGYCKKGKMEEAHKLKAKMASRGMKPDLYTFTSLIHGECIAGNVDKALKLFNEMSAKGVTKNVATYTAMISGLSREGRTDEAFKMYNDMINAGLKPDDRVYTSLVTSLNTPSQ